MSSSLPGESTPVVTAGLATAQLGQILNYCLLDPNSLFSTQVCDAGLGACTPHLCFATLLYNRFFSTGGARKGTFSFLSATCGLPAVTSAFFFTWWQQRVSAAAAEYNLSNTWRTSCIEPSSKTQTQPKRGYSPPQGYWDSSMGPSSTCLDFNLYLFLFVSLVLGIVALPALVLCDILVHLFVFSDILVSNFFTWVPIIYIKYFLLK